MADAKVKVILEGKDDTKKAFSSAETSISKFGSSLKTLGVIAAGAFAVKKIYDFGKASVEAFLEAEKSTVKLNSILKSMGGNMEAVRKQILQAADATTKLGFDNDLAAEKIGVFYQRTKDVTKAIELNAVAMDLARFKNIDLGTAADALNMALSGNVKVFKQFGIEVDETKTPMQAIAELQKMISTQAEDFAASVPGQMEVITASWGELKEGVGKALVEALQPFILQIMTFLQDPVVMETLKKLAETFGVVLVFAIKAVVQILGGLKEFLTNLFFVFIQIGQYLGEIFTPILKGIEKGFDAVVNSIKNAINWVKGLIDKFIALKNAAGNFIGGGVKSIVSSAKKGVNSLLGFDSGGVVPGALGAPQLAMVHGGETILPTHKGGGGSGIVINLNYPTLLDRSAIDKVSSQIMEQLRNNLRI